MSRHDRPGSRIEHRSALGTPALAAVPKHCAVGMLTSEPRGHRRLHQLLHRFDLARESCAEAIRILPDELGYLSLRTRIEDRQRDYAIRKQVAAVVESAQGHLNGFVDRSGTGAHERCADGRRVGQGAAGQAVSAASSPVARSAESTPADRLPGSPHPEPASPRSDPRLIYERDRDCCCGFRLVCRRGIRRMVALAAERRHSCVLLGDGSDVHARVDCLRQSAKQYAVPDRTPTQARDSLGA